MSRTSHLQGARSAILSRFLDTRTPTMADLFDNTPLPEAVPAEAARTE